jgi:electron transfer flavoprotein beta subunit
MSNITVLVATRAHAVSGRPARSPADATAVALALGLGLPGDVRLLSAGTMPDAVARDYLALGAPLIDVLESSAGGDVANMLLPFPSRAAAYCRLPWAPDSAARWSPTW